MPANNYDIPTLISILQEHSPFKPKNIDQHDIEFITYLARLIGAQPIDNAADPIVQQVSKAMGVIDPDSQQHHKECCDILRDQNHMPLTSIVLDLRFRADLRYNTDDDEGYYFYLRHTAVPKQVYYDMIGFIAATIHLHGKPVDLKKIMPHVSYHATQNVVFVSFTLIYQYFFLRNIIPNLVYDILHVKIHEKITYYQYELRLGDLKSLFDTLLHPEAYSDFMMPYINLENPDLKALKGKLTIQGHHPEMEISLTIPNMHKNLQNYHALFNWIERLVNRKPQDFVEMINHSDHVAFKIKARNKVEFDLFLAGLQELNNTIPLAEQQQDHVAQSRQRTGYSG